MSFWRFSPAGNSSDVDKILERPDHTLQELMAEPELLQEVMSPNTKLVEYLRSPDVLNEMIELMVDRGHDGEKDSNESQDQDHKSDDEGSRKDGDHEDLDDEKKEQEETQQRNMQVCAEILSSGVWSLTEALMESEETLDKLWQVLDFPTPLDINHASCFTRVNEMLLEKKTSEMLEYIRKQSNFVERFMRHIDNPPLMDFLLKVISTDKWGSFTGIIDFLQQQKLIPSLVSFLGPDVPSAVQSAAGDFLKAFVTISANSNTDNNTIGPNELSRELVSEPIVEELVRLMLYGGTGLATGVGVIIEIIRKNNSDYDFVPVMFITIESHPPGPKDPIYLGTLIKIFARNIEKFQEKLVKPRDDKLETPFGSIEPLGFERFRICELFAELLHCSNMSLLNDTDGENVVSKRDEERERLKKLAHQREYENESGKEIERGLESLEIRNDRFLEDDEQNDTEMKNADEEPAKEDEEGEEEKAKDESADSVQSEEAIRANPVVGDQLKIALADYECIPTILQMFFQFPWNNFLHNVVFDICQQVLNGPMNEGFNRFLTIDLFGKGQLTEVICGGHRKCEEYEKQNNTRLGYMGHLTLISEEVVKFTAVFAPESISQVVVDAVTNQDWINYVTHTLVRSREQYNAVLGGERPEAAESNQPGYDAIILKDKPEEQEDEEDEEQIMAAELGINLPKREELANDKFIRYISQELSGSVHLESGGEEEDEDEDDEADEHDQLNASSSSSQDISNDSNDDEKNSKNDDTSEEGGNEENSASASKTGANTTSDEQDEEMTDAS